jgi:hypothetical protein
MNQGDVVEVDRPFSDRRGRKTLLLSWPGQISSTGCSAPQAETPATAKSLGH